MTLSSAPATVPDLLRLLALPVFAWAAFADLRTRRVSSAIWIPLAAVGALALVWDARTARAAGEVVWIHEFLVPAAISLGFVVPIGYLFWWLGGFGGADAKALLVLALLFPTFPSYAVGPWAFPLTSTPVGSFAFTILTNAVLVGVALPLALAIRNALAGRIAPVMFVGWPVDWTRIPETHGRLLETPRGLSRRGLDLDALRMYLRWRGLTLEAVRANPDRYRDPATLPAEPNPPTDGAVDIDAAQADGGDLEHDVTPDVDATSGGEAADDETVEGEYEDPWGAEAFLEDIEGTAYGTAPERLRDGLEVLCAEDRVWISPGTPFLVPVFLGLLVALVYGDLLLGLVL